MHPLEKIGWILGTLTVSILLMLSLAMAQYRLNPQEDAVRIKALEDVLNQSQQALIQNLSAHIDRVVAQRDRCQELHTDPTHCEGLDSTFNMLMLQLESLCVQQKIPHGQWNCP